MDRKHQCAIGADPPSGTVEPMEDATPPRTDIGRLRSAGQLLKPVITIGKDGLSPGVVSAVDQALKDHELIKVKHDAPREDRRSVASTLAERTGSQIIQQVGHSLVLYRRREPDSKGT